MSASCRLTAMRATVEEFPSENRPTAQTTPTATAVPSEASASRADSVAERDLRIRASLAHDQIVAAVLGVRVVVVARVLRPLRAVADRPHLAVRDAQVDEVGLRGARPLLAERHVVLGGAQLVTVAVDLQPGVLLALDRVGQLLQDRVRVG